MNRKILISVTVILLTLSGTAFAEEVENEILSPPANMLVYGIDTSNAYINGDLVNTWTTPYIYGEISMFPVEKVIENLGGSVEYNNDTRILTLSLYDKTLSFSVDDKECNILDTVFYPIRNISDELGITVKWYDGLVTVSTDDTVLTDEQIAFYKNELGYSGYEDVLWRDRLTPQWFVDPYFPYTYLQMDADLHTLRKMYPDLFSEVYSIGQSEEGREILAINFGKGDTKVILCASMHAREYIATTYLMYYLDRYAYGYYTNEIKEDTYNIREILDNVTFIVVPQINPDGINLVQYGVENTKDPDAVKQIPFTSDGGEYGYRGWKSNINGVDLNANFPVLWPYPYGSPNSSSYSGAEAGSEAETRAMVDLMDNTDFEILVSFHTQGEVIYWMDGNCDRDLVDKHKPYIERICRETGFEMMPPDSDTGVGRCMTDYARYYKRAMAMTIELCPYEGNYPYPDEDFDRVAWPARNIGLMIGQIALELADPM